MGIIKGLLTLSSQPARLLRYVNCLDVVYARPIFLEHRRLTDKAGVGMEHLQSNPFFNKYAQKLKQVEESSPEQFQQKVKELPSVKKELHSKTIETSSEPSTSVNPDVLSLDSILKLENVIQKSADEIAEVWKTFHSDKECVFAVIPAPEYEEILARSKDFPTFLYPVPRGDGYEFFVQLWKGNVCHFTPLLSYQSHKENAVSCLSIVHYTELMSDKGIVLMKGQPLTSILSVFESQLLALQVKMYYGLQSGLKFNYVRMFNNSPDLFRHSDLIREFDFYKRDLKDKLKVDERTEQQTVQS